jgi:hypothetical protein
VGTGAPEKGSSVSGHKRKEAEKWVERVKIKCSPNK